MVHAILDSGDLTEIANGNSPDQEIIAHSAFTYGLPDKNDIAQDEALQLGQKALQDAYGLKSNVFELYQEICVYFDITNQEKPLWKFLFNPTSLPWRELEGGWDDPLKKLCYKVEIDAHTGEIKKTEEFEFQTLGRDIDYDLKWY